MKNYILMLFLSLTFITVFLSSFLVFIKIDNYSNGSIINFNSVTYLETSEKNIYVNQKKEIRINNKNYLVKITSKIIYDSTLIYELDSNKFNLNNANCKIKMDKLNFILFIFKLVKK